MLAAFLALSLSAFPEFSGPEVLIDLNTRPRQPPVDRLLGATATGVLVVTSQRFDFPEEHRLWWAPFSAPATELGLTTTGVSAQPVGDRFIVLDEGVASVIELDGATARRTPLVTGVAKLEFVQSNSTSEAWFFDGTQLWTTDGTLNGTSVTPRNMQSPAFETNRRIASFIATDTVSVWDAVGARTALITEARSISAAGSNFVFGGRTLRNESGEVLVNAPCTLFPGGGWALCGTSIFSTDGTAANTTLRDDGPFSTQAHASTATALVYTAALSGEVRLLTGATGGPITLNGTCSDFGPGLRGAFLVCGHAVMWLDGSPTQVTASGRFSAAFFVNDELIILQEDELLRSDGTFAGTHELTLDFGVTDSSDPLLISSNGSTALFATLRDAGVWLTDGTPSGTVRVGDRGAPWGRGAFGGSMSGATAFDEHARPVEVPAGVIGVSGEWLIGLDGCRAFRVVADGSSAEFATEGCVTEVLVFDDAAFLRFVDGNTSLVRAPHQPIALGNDVDRAVRPRCDERRCWFCSKRINETLEVRSVELATEKVTVEEQVNTTGEFELLFGSGDVAVSEARATNSNVFRIQRRGKPTVSVPELTLQFQNPIRPSFGVAKDGVVYLGAGDDLLRVDKTGTAGTVGRCLDARVAVSGDDAWAVCENEGEEGFRLFRVVSDVLTEVQFSRAIALPGFDGTLTWFSTLGPGSPGPVAVIVTDGTERKQFDAWFGSDFAAVRAGIVFSGSATVDRELAIVRYRRPGCGCESTGGLALTAIAWLICSRRRGSNPKF